MPKGKTEKTPEKTDKLSNEDRIKWRQLVIKDANSFVKAPVEAKEDLAVCLEAVKRNGIMLEHCSDKMRANRNIVLEAVRNDAEAFGFADEGIRGDPEIVQTAVRRRGQLLRFASEELRSDYDLCLEVVHDLWFTAEYLAHELRYNQDFWREVIEQDPETGWMAFSYAPMELRNDPDLVMEAIKVDPMAFKFASDELRNDPSFVTDAIKVNWIVIKHASAKVRKNAEVVLEAVRQDLEALQYASEELISDPSFALEAIGCQGRAIAHSGMTAHLQEKKEWVLKAVQKNPDALTYADDDRREDRDIVNQSMGSRLGANSGILWKIDEKSKKWAPGTTALALEALQKEGEHNKHRDALKAAPDLTQLVDKHGDPIKISAVDAPAIPP